MSNAKVRIFELSIYLFLLFFACNEMVGCGSTNPDNYCVTTHPPYKVGSEFQVNTYTTNDQENPSVAAIGCQRQKFVVTWQSSNQPSDSSNWGVFAQVFNSTDGTKIGTEFLVNNEITSSQEQPAIASIGRGGPGGTRKEICDDAKEKFVICWQSNHQDSVMYNIYCKIFNSADGSEIGTEFQVNVYDENQQIYPTVTALSAASYQDDRFLVCWASQNQDADNYGIFCAVYNSTQGDKIIDEFKANDYIFNEQNRPAVASLRNRAAVEVGVDKPDTEYVVSWQSNYHPDDGSTWGIFGQVFDAEQPETTIGPEFFVNEHTSESQYYPTITSTKETFVISWSSDQQDGSEDGVYAQIYNSTDYTKIGNEFQVNNFTTQDQSSPSVDTIMGGNREKFVISWESNHQDSAKYEIYLKVFDSHSGKALFSEDFLVTELTQYSQQYPKITSIGGSGSGNELEDEQFVVIWQSADQDGNGEGIFAQIYSSILDCYCSEGFFTNSTLSNECRGCPVGNYQDKEGQTNCEECKIGTYQDTEGSISCINCTKGHYQILEGQAECMSCPVGNYQDQEGQIDCHNCTIGTYQDIEGSSSCINCTKGHYQILEGQAECMSCPVGNYQDQEGQIDCHNCTIGTYQDIEGSSSCINCTKGHYQILEGQAECMSCPVGNYQDQEGQIDCHNCTIGTYQDIEGSSSCINCTKGHYQILEGQTECMSCPVGNYQDQEGQIDCHNCTIGTYQDTEGSSSCINCSKGHYQILEGQTECMSCPVGNYQDQEGQIDCHNCTIGTYQDSEGSSSCINCSKGHYQILEGQTECMSCPVGNYQDQEGQANCHNCTMGTYQDSEGSSSCSNCPKGNYQDQEGQTECTGCQVGYYQDEEGQMNCKQCKIGTYQDIEGSSSCSNCPRGQHQSLLGQTECQSCPRGKYQDQYGQANCKNCSLGTYQPEGGKASCIRCPYDTYQDQYGQKECIQCPSGTFTSEKGSSSKSDCISCEKGTYWNEHGNGGGSELEPRTCQPCSTGTYQDQEGQTQCNNCSVGTYNSKKGSTSIDECVQCELGTYSNLEAQQGCSLCAMGQYQNARGQMECKSCFKGSYTNKEGSTACNLCLSGTYQNENAKSQCKNCAFNTWQSEIGTTDCNYCPMNSETLSTKRTSVKECYCSIGHYGNPGEYCEKCPDNGICNKFNQQYPFPKQGYWSSSDNPNNLIKCKIYDSCPGFEVEKCNTELGYSGIQCSECLRGFYQFESQCVQCPNNNVSRLIFFFVIFLFSIILLLVIAKKGKNYFGSFSIFINFFQVIAILPKLEFNWPIKLVNFFQFFSLLNFNIDFLALECTINLSYTEKWFIIMLMPFILIGILLLIYFFLFVHSYFVKFVAPRLLNTFPSFCVKPNRSNHNKFLLPLIYLRFYFMKFFLNSWSKENLKVFLNTCVNVFVASLLVLYLILALKIFEFFDCTYSSSLKQYIFEPEKSHYCFDDWWYKILPFVIFFMIIYIVGIPIFFGYILWYHSKNVNEKIFNQRLSLLYSRYKIEYFYWEIIIIFRKFFIVVFEIYLTNYAFIQIILLILCLIVSIIIQNIYKPYNTPHRNFYEFSLLTIMLFIFFVSLLFIKNENNEELYQTLADVVIIIFSISIAILLLISFFEMKNRIVYNKKRSKIKKNLKSLALSNNQFSNKNEAIYLIVKSKRNHNLLSLLKFFAQISNSKKKKVDIVSKIITNHYESNIKKNQSISNSIQYKWKNSLLVIILKWYHYDADFYARYKFSQFLIKFMNYCIENDTANSEKKLL
ncbi:insulin-like growth factor binding proteinn-terminal [Anaeramoeba flamelloides]|uniref:Insulin-like growth factor binding proteinn-terminal n=1 Tax=Anaeramoeba flamelloides TaxID=1746091 RepID=A0AAV7Z1I8_9EUKA|nr:insulin-like growth factor binding proteinn-terminal [Anaeramoeba flamelloides]